MKLFNCVLTLTLISCAYQTSLAQKTTDYDLQMRTKIVGNGEQPSQIFIVPWNSRIKVNLAIGDVPVDQFGTLSQPVSEKELLFEQRMLKSGSKVE